MSGEIAWSDAARALFALSVPTAVSAGAGSGKTTCLVELCLRLLSGEATGTPCDPGEIVAITFTEKAAAELEERLRDAVVARAGAARAGSDEERAWRLRLHALERMPVGTIHGFARRLLREHALDAGLDPDLEILDEETSRAWRRDAARAAVLAALDAGRPVAQQLVAAVGAGGRRSGLADAVADLARERATLGEVAPPRPAPDREPEALAARAAALSAARALLGSAGEVATASGRRAMAQLAEALARVAPQDSGGSLRPEAIQRFADLVDAVRGWRVGKRDGERARSLKDDLSRACEELALSAAETLARPQKAELCELVAGAEARYREHKRRARALDFDDLLLAARELLRLPGGPCVELRRRFRAVLVDEYQDVNQVQHDLFELLTGAGDGPPPPLLVAVGDLKQSIYRFRGADVAVFRAVLDAFGGGAGRVLQLTTNHRSSAAVLELVNAVSTCCMRPAGGEPRAYELSFGPADRLLAARAGRAGPPCEILEDIEEGSSAERRRREARAIAARIGALVSGVAGVEVTERAGPGGEEPWRCPRHGDIAILFRRLTQIGDYERALREADIPYRLARGGGFWQAPEVRDLGELLATIAEPEDALGWAAVLRSPFCAAGDGALFTISRLGWSTLARRAPGEVARAVVEADPGAAREAERVQRFLEEWQALRAIRDRLPVGELLARAVERLHVEAAHRASPGGERRVANLRKALALAARFAARGGSAAAFAERVRTMAGEPAREPEADLEAGDAVALLSVHQAKGLEWPIVFVPDMGATSPRDARRAVRAPGGALAAAFHDPSSDTFHTTSSLAAAREEASRAAAAESRRLLYVALTRARDRLILSGEAARGGDTWRAMVEAAVEARPELVLRVPMAEAGTFTEGSPDRERGSPSVPLEHGYAAPESPPVRPERRCEAPESRGRPSTPAALRPTLSTNGDIPPFAVSLSNREGSPAPLPAVRVAVTHLAEYARCPRRVFLAHHLGVGEHAAALGSPHDDPERATARGTLAHAMLSETDLTAPPLERRGQMAAAAARRGYDPHSPSVRRIAADVWRFTESRAGEELARAARAGSLSCEVPFLLRVDGEGAPACYLVGAIDALLVEPDAVAVVDFKYALARPGMAERYRIQLLAYALAATRAFPGREVTARLQFLRGRCDPIDVTPGEGDLRRFELEAPGLAAAMHASGLPPPGASALGRSERQCTDEGCGFVRHCHPRPGARGGGSGAP